MSNKRFSVNRAGKAVLKLKASCRNGTLHIVMSPMEFLQRLAALAPRPRLHLIRFHGVFAPHGELRSKAVPVSALVATAGDSREGDCTHAHSVLLRMTWTRLLKSVFDDFQNNVEAW